MPKRISALTRDSDGIRADWPRNKAHREIAGFFVLPISVIMVPLEVRVEREQPMFRLVIPSIREFILLLVKGAILGFLPQIKWPG